MLVERDLEPVAGDPGDPRLAGRLLPFTVELEAEPVDVVVDRLLHRPDPEDRVPRLKVSLGHRFLLSRLRRLQSDWKDARASRYGYVTPVAQRLAAKLPTRWPAGWNRLVSLPNGTRLMIASCGRSASSAR